MAQDLTKTVIHKNYEQLDARNFYNIKVWYNTIMNVTREDIAHLAELSDFSLSEKEIDTLGGDLQGIITYISQLDELDTENVEPTYQVFEMENIWRADEVLPQDANREQLLALTKEEKDHQIKVPKVL